MERAASILELTPLLLGMEHGNGFPEHIRVLNLGTKLGRHEYNTICCWDAVIQVPCPELYKKPFAKQHLIAPGNKRCAGNTTEFLGSRGKAYDQLFLKNSKQRE